MPRYYCDYCDTYLTHDSPVVRKQHNTGYKHKANVRNYYMQFEEAQTQSLIDNKIMEFEAKSREAFQAQVAAAFQSQMAQRATGAALPRPMAPPGAALGDRSPGACRLLLCLRLERRLACLLWGFLPGYRLLGYPHQASLP
eukprot:jgi/Botrbrau1/5332/Bobra.0346s0006.1